MFLYAVSLIKFFLRDPAGADVGPQGPIELALLTASALLLLPAFYRRDWKLFVSPSAKAFVAFGAIAVVSSPFSYYPLLSSVKGLSFILVCGIAVVASSAFGSSQVIKYLYYSIFIVLLVGLVLKLRDGGPLLDIDDYSGRARFTMFALHPSMLADLCAVTLLSSFLMAKRPPLYCQAFLLALNIAGGSRTGTAVLVVVLLAIGLASVRLTFRSSGVLFVGCCLGFFLALAMLVAIHSQNHPSSEITSIGQSIYGDKLDEDVSTLNGRTDVWDAAAPMISHSILLGYGLGGSRDVLLKNTSWAWEAGDAHNALIDLILGAGFPGMLVYLFGWAGAARRAWRSRGFVHIGALGIYAYILGYGIVSPNLTNLQGLATFLIITVDAMVCAELYSVHAQSRVSKIAALSGEPLENPAGT